MVDCVSLCPSPDAMVGGRSLVVTYHFTCWPAERGGQDTQALNLNLICLPVPLNFCFWTVSLHGAEICIVSAGMVGGRVSLLWPLEEGGSWLLEKGVWSPWKPDLGAPSSCPASAMRPLIRSSRLPFSELQHPLSAAQILRSPLEQ